jgi:uncharacterized protein (TIGR03067 family)
MGVLSLLAVLATVRAGTTEKASQPLQGQWVATAAERNGKPAPEVVGHKLTFAGERFTVLSPAGKLLYEGTIRLDAAQKPATIDFRHDRGLLAGTTWKGIYALQGTKLRTCDNAPDTARGRPTSFDTSKQKGCVAITFERAPR